MQGSLKDQLRQAGLLKKQPQKKKRKRGKAELDPAEKQRREELAAIDRAKKERDRELNQQRETQREARERAEWFRQLLREHALPRDKAEDGAPAFHFTLDGKVHQLYVSESERKALGDGSSGIAFMDARYSLLPATIAKRIAEKFPRRIWIGEQQDKAQDENDPYAEYQVPDDLMW